VALAIELNSSGAHRADTVFGNESSPMVCVMVAKSRGKQHLHTLSQQLLSRIAKQDFGSSINEDDAPIAIDKNHGVRSRFQQVPEDGLYFRMNERFWDQRSPFPMLLAERARRQFEATL
jgi:hypothetical protein